MREVEKMEHHSLYRHNTGKKWEKKMKRAIVLSFQGEYDKHEIDRERQKDKDKWKEGKA